MQCVTVIIQLVSRDHVYRLFDAYQRGLPSKVDFVDEVERWNIRRALVGDKSGRPLDTLHATNRELHRAGSRIINILLIIPVSSATRERSFSAMRCVKSYLRSTMGDERLSNLSHMHIHGHVQVDLNMIFDDFS